MTASSKKLDPRGGYLLVPESGQVLVYFGKECPQGNKVEYLRTAKERLVLLQKYERAPQSDIEVIEQGEETEYLWNLFSLKERPVPYDKIWLKNGFWNDWFLDVKFKIDSLAE